MSNPVPSHPRVTTAWGIPGSWAAGRHTGEDYGSPGVDGARVVATADGTVRHAGYGGWGTAYGMHVVVDHGAGVQAGYMHLRQTVVRNGQAVGAGQLLGYVGSTGNSTGPHLHYEERTSPYRYGDDRRPRLPGTDDQLPEDDVSPEDVEKIAQLVATRVNGILGDYDAKGKKRRDTDGDRGDVRLRQLKRVVRKIATKVGA